MAADRNDRRQPVANGGPPRGDDGEPAAKGNADERDAPSFGLPLVIEPVPDWLAASTRTRADGSYELEHLSAGEHVLRFSAPGHGAQWTPRVKIAEGATVDLGTRALGSAGRLEGTVREEIYIGTDRRYVIALDSGESLVVRVQNSRVATGGPPVVGERRALVVRTDDIRALTE